MAPDTAPVRLNGVLGLVTRRWYLVIVGLLLTLPLSYQAAQMVSPTYTMKASVVLLAPTEVVGQGGNPYLAMGGLEAAVDVAAVSLSSDAVQQRLAETGALSSVVERDGGTAAPMLLVTVEASTAGAAEEGIAVVLDAIPTTLATIQESAGVDDDQLIRSEVVAASERPLVSYKPQLRVGLVVAAAGMGATLVVTALLDSLLRRRRRTTPSDDESAPRLRVSEPVSETEEADGEVSDLRAARGRKR